MLDKQLIGSVTGIQEGGVGLRFKLHDDKGETIPAFIICYDGLYLGYINRCGHIAVQLDYLPGQFFSDDGQTLVCATHGAEYAPDSGQCLGGPCFGVGLESLPVLLVDEQLYLQDPRYTVVANQDDNKS